MTLILNDEDVASLLTMRDCISVLEDAFRDLGRGDTVNAPRRDSFLASNRPDAYYSFKTIEGGLERLGVVAQRINSDLVSYPVLEGLPRRVKIPAATGNRYVGLIFLYSTETIELLAIITDGHLQRMRVAGTTGVGAKYLAREDAKIAALLGSGWQAESAAWALAAARPLSTIRVFSPSKEHREAFAKEVGPSVGIEVIPVASAREAVQGADIVAVATNSHGPVVRGEWVEPGMHLTSVLPTDFDDQSWQRSALIVFSGPGGSSGYYIYTTMNPLFETIRGGADYRKVEEERFQRYRQKIVFLSDIVAGKVTKRTGAEQITMMNKNWGLGIEFASVGKLVYDLANRRGVGRQVPTEWFSQISHP